MIPKEVISTDHYARQRNSAGRFTKTVEGGWKTKQPEYQKEYLRTHPWARNWYFSKVRAKKKGWEHTLTIPEFKELWLRDKAHLLKVPSIDRIDPSKGYIQGNCRFLERSLNSSLGNLGRSTIHVCPNCGWRNNKNPKS